jgi:hypothetical protein
MKSQERKIEKYLISRGSWQLSGSSLILRCAKEVDQRFQH